MDTKKMSSGAEVLVVVVVVIASILAEELLKNCLDIRLVWCWQIQLVSQIKGQSSASKLFWSWCVDKFVLAARWWMCVKLCVFVVVKTSPPQEEKILPIMLVTRCDHHIRTRDSKRTYDIFRSPL